MLLGLEKGSQNSNLQLDSMMSFDMEKCWPQQAIDISIELTPGVNMKFARHHPNKRNEFRTAVDGIFPYPTKWKTNRDVGKRKKYRLAIPNGWGDQRNGDVPRRDPGPSQGLARIRSERTRMDFFFLYPVRKVLAYCPMGPRGFVKATGRSVWTLDITRVSHSLLGLKNPTASCPSLNGMKVFF